jgi:plastocyanin
MRRAALIMVGVVVGLAVGAASAAAATVTVTIGTAGQLAYSPANATIHVGDTVHWVWGSSFHSSTSGSPPGTPDGKWDSGVQNQPFSFDQTFTKTGTFHYFCRIHYAEGMVGSVTVTTKPPRLWVSSGQTNSVSLFGAGVTGNAAPLATHQGASTGLSGPFGLALDRTGRLRVANAAANSLSVFGAGSSGNTAPLGQVTGGGTKLASPEGITLDTGGDVFTADHASNSVTEYAAAAAGNTPPVATIGGAATGLSGPSGVARDGAGHVFVANTTANSVTEYAHGASGNIAPVATIAGAATQLSAPDGVSIGPAGVGAAAGNRLFVANRGSSSITEYPLTASGNIAPVATIMGAATGLDGPAGVAVDLAGSLFVPNVLNNTVTEYSRGASGNTAPFAVLKGAGTLLSAPTFIALVTPSVTTGAAGSVTSSSAALHATLNPNGVDTRYAFQYGPTAAYGNTTVSADAGSATSAVSGSAAIGSLAAHTTYHFRVVATSDAGTRYGADAQFTTS